MERFSTRPCAPGPMACRRGSSIRRAASPGTEELARLCGAVARYCGIYTSHVRGERETILEAVAEAIEIGRRSGVAAVEISHNAPKWGAPAERRRQPGPHRGGAAGGHGRHRRTTTSTPISRRGCRGLCRSRCWTSSAGRRSWRCSADPVRREQVRRDIAEDRVPGAGYAGLVRHGAVRPYRGALMPTHTRTARPIDRRHRRRARRRRVRHLSSTSSWRRTTASSASSTTSTRPTSAPCRASAGHGVLGRVRHAARRHARRPRCTGRAATASTRASSSATCATSRVLRLEEAVRKMTSFPAQRFRLLDRGALRPGCAPTSSCSISSACTTVPPISTRTASRFANIPHRYPTGIDWVVVNGFSGAGRGRAHRRLARPRPAPRLTSFDAAAGRRHTPERTKVSA